MQKQVELWTGDIVHLNSGGPDLKVVALNGDQVEVEWINETTVERATFPRVCVR